MDSPHDARPPATIRGSRRAASRSRRSQPRRSRIDAEEHRADPAGDRDRRRDADMAVARKQHERSDRPRWQARQSAANIGVRVSSCANDTAPSTFSSAWPGQPGADRRQRRGDRRGVARAEGAALEQAAGDRLRQHARRRPRPAAQGRARSRRRAIARRRCRVVAARTLAAIAGTITAAIAIETTPSGSS